MESRNSPKSERRTSPEYIFIFFMFSILGFCWGLALPKKYKNEHKKNENLPMKCAFFQILDQSGVPTNKLSYFACHLFIRFLVFMIFSCSFSFGFQFSFFDACTFSCRLPFSFSVNCSLVFIVSFIFSSCQTCSF